MSLSYCLVHPYYSLLLPTSFSVLFVPRRSLTYFCPIIPVPDSCLFLSIGLICHSCLLLFPPLVSFSLLVPFLLLSCSYYDPLLLSVLFLFTLFPLARFVLCCILFAVAFTFSYSWFFLRGVPYLFPVFFFALLFALYCSLPDSRYLFIDFVISFPVPFFLLFYHFPHVPRTVLLIVIYRFLRLPS